MKKYNKNNEERIKRNDAVLTLNTFFNDAGCNLNKTHLDQLDSKVNLTSDKTITRDELSKMVYGLFRN